MAKLAFLAAACFLLVLLAAPHASSAAATATGDGLVVEITAKNYDTVVYEGPWMVVVSANWCPHCKQLEPTWTRLAERLEGKVRVGKINGPEQEILTRRLHVAGYPTIFHVDKQGKIRDYGERSRELEKLYLFAISGHKSVEPLPWYHTPHSLFGQMVKAILELPQDLQELYQFLSTDLGLSDVFIIFSGLVLPLIGGVFVIGLMDLIFVQMHCRSNANANSSAAANQQQQQQQQQQANRERPHAD
mmetsp:Transcript_11404/g.29401  ORF Transcript_11404/g.29401 Transcript_11404/m.29401 type:complete len:246 (-) Transcript_11404:222-959(-)|eukprot:CAMPEP_0197490502 /NCGR_PEP_ID=MMETSP1311-20131121/5036_1 /TAXON_ID=464262 /ORGANISM="Genus nov. species nov., Strain RCC856" /LENGTH=245 /DNA_ID=CAMNT_0043035029 /DNA_START=77 /DNA_END=814 /DNA_ORIENTATION=+